MLIEDVIKQCEENEAVGLVEVDTKQLADWLRELMQLRYNNAKSDYDEVRGRLQMYRELLAIKLGTCRANVVKKIKENLSRDAAAFLKDFGYLTDAEKMSIKSLTCLQTRA